MLMSMRSMIDLWNGIPRLIVDNFLINSFTLSLIDIAFDGSSWVLCTSAVYHII
jgi:hypothetical protein